jgi:hypothetical protein
VSGRLRNLIPLELIIQGCTADTEMLGRLFLDPTALLQGFQQQISLMFFDGRQFVSQGATRLGLDYGGQVRGLDSVSLGQHGCMLDTVFQLPDIARPVVIQEQAHGLGGKPLNFLVLFLGKTAQEIAGQQGDVIGPLLEFRQVDGNDVETVIEIMRTSTAKVFSPPKRSNLWD